jgi:SapC
MANTARLNNVEHADLTVVHGYSAAFGDGVNQTIAFPTEYHLLQREYVILIHKNADGAFQSIALLGLDRDENLFLSADGWNARYVPAMHQRGPFMIGFSDVDLDGHTQREPVINVDLDHPRIAAGGGQPVFLPHGGNTPYLTHIMGVLQTIHEGASMMQSMLAAFDAIGILEKTVIDIALSDTEQYKLEDYYTINQANFAALDGDVLQKLSQNGYLTAAIYIMTSINNAQHLIALKNRNQI